MFTFDFPVIDDDVYEKDESFSLQITSASHPQIVIDGRNEVARINIADNENCEYRLYYLRYVYSVVFVSVEVL